MKTLLTIFSILIVHLSAYSQTDSLNYYLETATRNNPAVLQKFAEYQASLQKVPQVGSLPDPELSAGIFLSPMELVGGNQLADIRLMQMFPWFGVLKNAKDEMSLMAKAKFELFRDTKLQVCFDLQQTWYELHKNQSAIHSSEKNLEILQSLERISLVRFKSGSAGSSGLSPAGAAMNQGTSQNASQGSSGMQQMGGNAPTGSATPASQSSAPMQGPSGGSGLADLYRIQMETGELENNIALLKNQQKTLISRFNNLMNRPVQMPVTLPDTLKPDVLDIPVQAVSDSMLVNNPMLGMLNYEKESLDARKQMVTRMGYPMVGLGINYSLINKNPMSSSTMNGKDMIMPMVTLTLPIYRKKYNAMQAETDLLKTAVSHGIQATTSALRNEYAEAVQNYQDGARRMELYIRQYELASHSLNILIKSFSSSGAGLSDLLRVRQQTLDYGLKQVDAIADFNTAIAKLRRLMDYTINQ
ncbi:MAG TPA: TolC family protein [Prolixibacteraceae bacterium]|nr:TolC family protein [Prolixibacteraceae bacterium]